MKKNLNIIRINGIRGLLIAIGVVCCLFAGFIVFPGYVAMFIWNQLFVNADSIPSIGILQGVLLWGILITLYFICKKDRVIVCFKTPQGLSEEELKTVFADIKKQTESDPVLKAMLKARESELQIQKKEESADTNDNKVNTDEKV